MITHIVEATQGSTGNHGKFMLMRFTDEWSYRSQLPNVEWPTGVPDFLLSQVCGWGGENLWVLDLQTGEGAFFRPGGMAKADLDKHAVWVCPMFEPFLEWLYDQDLSDITALPTVVLLPHAPGAMYGYRRPGPTVALPPRFIEQCKDSAYSDEWVGNAVRAWIDTGGEP